LNKGNFYQIFFYILIGLLISFSAILPQYNNADVELVRTTFNREFDRNILQGYLHSSNQQKVIAGLLSVSHSHDTSFVEELINLDFDAYGYYISFALGQIGESTKSTNYLLEKLSYFNMTPTQKNIFEALGKIGNQQTLQTITNSYFQKKIKNKEGISIALTNFNSRGIELPNRDKIEILKQEIATDPVYSDQTAEAFQALYRMGPDDTMNDILVKSLYLSDSQDRYLYIKQNALGALRKLKYFPDDLPLLREMLAHKDWRIRTEALKTTCYYNFKNEEELKLYLFLLKDLNPNTARQCAISLRNLSLGNSLKSFLKNEIINRLENSASYTSNVKGELFISYANLFPNELFNSISKFEKIVKRKFIYKALSENFIFPERNLNFLLNEIKLASESDKIEILNALLSLQKYLTGNVKLQETLISNLASDFASIISVAAEGIDSSTLALNRDRIKSIIRVQTSTHINDNIYSASLVSLTLLSKKIDEQFYATLLDDLERSEIYSVKKWAMQEKGNNAYLPKPISFFDELWENAFKYKGVRINTNKGSFEILFTPDTTPISVGNFCSLASKNFFDNHVFHRVVPNFVIQTGDPDGTGWGGPGYEIVSEFSPVEFNESNVGMASSGKDTEGSQWFVMHGKFPHLNGRYSNFGKVIAGKEIVDIIDQNDYIISVQLLKQN